ncbi:MAG: hypothetical protein ABL897_01165 [Hyphomicrobium sp.]
MTQPFSSQSGALAVTPLGTLSIPADAANNGAYTPINDLVPPAILGFMGDVQAVWVDAANATDPVTIRNVQTRLYQTWPPGSVGWQILLAKSGALQLEAYCYSATTITLAVSNLPLNSYVADSGVIKSSIYSNVTRVAASAASKNILDYNAERQGFAVFNDSTATLYLLLIDGIASPTNFTVRIGPYGYYESPFAYGGIVYGIWTAATGAAQVTEII